MKQYLAFVLLILTISCNRTNEENTVQEVNNTETDNLNSLNLIIGERIDGPANIRKEPNGEVLFELYDNALVEATQLKDDWFQIMVYADIEFEEFGLDSITKGRYIISDGDTIGRIMKTHYVSTGRGKDDAYAMVYGYTHKKNIKSETIIENILTQRLTKNQRELANWTDFIKSFKLRENAVDYDKFETYYNYENSMDDPSPGFRIVLLFQSKRLVGFIHSRQLKLDNFSTHKLNWSYYISFFNDFQKNEQLDFVNYMNEWIQGVD